ncbi:MAG: HAD family hydrolase [Chromatiales bacterium]|jgi:putative hydrolase of the HAD superfamily|nr:HAD family hydrolase [Chromatiales bacterium]
MTALHVVFDLDDTLYPERSFALSGFRAADVWAAERWGISGLGRDMAALLDAGHLGGLFKLSLEKHRPEADEHDLAELVKIYRTHPPDIELFADARTALDECAEFGPMGLITDGTHWMQENKVGALEIANRFQKIIYTGALGPDRQYHKPSPRAFELMEAALAGDGVRLVYVGDNPAKDFIAPNQRGWETVQIIRPEKGIHDPTSVAPEGAPKHSLTSMDQLADLLRGLPAE